MNIVRSFAEYLQGVNVAILGNDLFISRAPSSSNVPDRIFWLKAAGGPPVQRSVNGGSRQSRVIELYHRDVKAEGVYETMQEIADDITCAGCVTLSGYDVIEVQTSGPWTDQDLDNEERQVGLLQITITTHKEC